MTAAPSIAPVPGASAEAGELRRFVAQLEACDELIRIDDEVDWNLELGARARAEAAGRNRALLFERIRGYEDAQVLVNALGSPARIAIALGLPPGRSFRELRRVVRDRIEHPIAPVAVVEESHDRETHAGENVDLTMLPVPKWAPEDAGRYLGTWHVNVTRDPETGARNLGVYRMQLVDRDTALVSASNGSHLLAHARRAEERGEALEMAVAIGVAEPLVLAAGMAVSPDTDEVALAGALAGAPVPVRRARLIGLDVPADAEIVIEGHLVPNERAAEGPFIDYAGAPSANPRGLVFKAALVDVRRSPIFRGAAVGHPGAEDHLVYALLAAAGCFDFHGSESRRRLQQVALNAGRYRLFQLLGRVHPPRVSKLRAHRY